MAVIFVGTRKFDVTIIITDAERATKTCRKLSLEIVKRPEYTSSSIAFFGSKLEFCG